MSIVTEADVFDVLEELLFVFDETGQFVDWNRATAHVTGYSEAELATMTPVDFFEGDDTERRVRGDLGAAGDGKRHRGGRARHGRR
jgi:PAS domain S-box